MNKSTGCVNPDDDDFRRQVSQPAIYHWMVGELHADPYSYTDNACVLIATQLAETAADIFNHDEWLDDEDHWVWECAVRAITQCGVTDDLNYRVKLPQPRENHE